MQIVAAKRRPFVPLSGRRAQIYKLDPVRRRNIRDEAQHGVAGEEEKANEKGERDARRWIAVAEKTARGGRKYESKRRGSSVEKSGRTPYRRSVRTWRFLSRLAALSDRLFPSFDSSPTSARLSLFRFAFPRAFRGGLGRRVEGTRLLSATLHLILRALHRRWHFYAPAMTSARNARRHPVTSARRKLTVLCNPIRSFGVRYYTPLRRREEKRREEARFVWRSVCATFVVGNGGGGWLGGERAPYRSRRAPNDRSVENRDSWLPRSGHTYPYAFSFSFLPTRFNRRYRAGFLEFSGSRFFHLRHAVLWLRDCSRCSFFALRSVSGYGGVRSLIASADLPFQFEAILWGTSFRIRNFPDFIGIAE